jgi:hypothetical protein
MSAPIPAPAATERLVHLPFWNSNSDKNDSIATTDNQVMFLPTNESSVGTAPKTQPEAVEIKGSENYLRTLLKQKGKLTANYYC